MACKPPKPKRTLIESGTHLAVCTMIAEVGTHTKTYKGQDKDNYQVAITFEFPDLRVQGEKDGKKFDFPQRKSCVYTFSYHEKSNLGGIMTSWVGKKITNDFDLFEMLGKNAMITITHDTGSNDVIYDNISAVTQLPARITPVKAEGELIRYSFQENLKNVPEKMPKWILELIQSSPEWKFLDRFDKNVPQGSGEPQPEDTTDYAEEEIPF